MAAKRSASKAGRGKVKVALIGAGGMANGVHYPSLASFKDVSMVGLCDWDEHKAGETAERFGVKRTYTDYRKMLAETKPDAVYALMPPHILYDVAMDVMEAGYDLFVEKPPAVTTFQTVCLAKMAREKKLVTGVGFQRRYHPLFTHCYKKVVRKGPVNQVNVSFVKNAPVEKVMPYYRGAIDILRCDAIHAVDSLRYYAGRADVKSVSAVVRQLDSWYPVSFHALVHFANDVVGVLAANWRVGKRFLKAEFHTAGASAYMDADGAGELWCDNADKPTVATTHTEVAGSDEMYVHQGFLAQARAFIDAVKKRRQLHNNFDDVVKTMALADQIYAAAEQV